ncbi:MAG TPA: glycosyltransferase family 2 protein [Bryobacteraceae bacterium]|jgi:GT2 family glycosyltransferase|nr:glycosyltransferase family 2 protein [Bryobacteraceae bacterium]
MTDRVCAVVVTFNRKTLLRACLQALQAQTRPLDCIVVVNNASTDGTGELLSAEFPALPEIRLPVNRGGAGGFAEGLRWAFAEGFDWIWVMDDDVLAVPDALEGLLTFGDYGDLIVPRKLVNGEPLVWESVWDARRCVPVTFNADVSFENGRPWVSTMFANFEGTLMRRMIVEKAGLPDPRYFVGGDDTIYGFVASLHARVIYANCTAMRKDSPPGRRARLQYYMGLRNRFLHFEHLSRAGLPVARGGLLAGVCRQAAQDLGEILRHSGQRNLSNLLAVFQGVRDGVRGRFGPPPWLQP